MLFLTLFVLLTAGANAVDKWYTIFPTDMSDGQANDRISEALTNDVGKDNIHHSHSTALKSHLYWYALLNDQQKANYDTFPNVSIS